MQASRLLQAKGLRSGSAAEGCLFNPQDIHIPQATFPCQSSLLDMHWAKYLTRGEISEVPPLFIQLEKLVVSHTDRTYLADVLQTKYCFSPNLLHLLHSTPPSASSDQR